MADKIPQSTQISGGLYLVSLGFVCVYLYNCGEFWISFDAGMSASGTKKAVSKTGIDPQRVRHVLLTHSDRDHIGGVAAFPNATVHFPRAEMAMVDHTVPRHFGFIFNRPPAAAYELVDDEQILTLGRATVRCISTPGHTAGHMAFLIDGKYLIAGDILNIKDGAAVMDRGAININQEQREASIRKLAKLEGVSFLCPMHSRYTTDFGLAMQSWRT